jgi:hypothetical protein
VQQQVDLEVAQCPVGRYSSSQNLHSDTAARCMACPAGSVTEEPGSTDITQCTGEALCYVTICCVTLRNAVHV